MTAEPRLACRQPPQQVTRPRTSCAPGGDSGGRGIGKPEPLGHALAGARSRRITEEHRLVYLVGEDLVILQARYHYG